MGRTTSTQRGASRSTKPTTASSGGRVRGGTSTKRASAAKRGSKAAPRKPSQPRRADLRPAGPWVPVVIVALVVVLGWSLYPALKLEYQASRRAASKQQEYESLRARQATLRAEVAALRTPEGVERAAREKLGYTKKGENAYVVIPDGSAAASAATTASMAGGAATSIVQDMLDAIFGVSSPASVSVAP
jgi:cell division protein FtsB